VKISWDTKNECVLFKKVCDKKKIFTITHRPYLANRIEWMVCRGGWVGGYLPRLFGTLICGGVKLESRGTLV